jgi:ADP-heptose:LPS heptosyltransferase
MQVDIENIKNILIYRCGTVGDSIVAVPAINLLKNHFTKSSFFLMTASDTDGKIWSDTIFKEFDLFDKFITYSSSDLQEPNKILSLIRQIRSLSPDLVIHLSSDKNSASKIWRDRIFFYLAGAKRFLPFYSSKITFGGHLKRSDRIYPREVNRFVEGLKAIGIDGEGVYFDLPVHEGNIDKVTNLVNGQLFDSQSIMIGMCPWSKQPAKRWPVERFAQLGQRIVEGLDANIVVVGGNDEAYVGERISRDWPKGRFAILAGKLSVLEIAEALRRCAFYVGNDTGSMHLAAAVGTPCIAIFSAKDPPESWHPFGDNHVVLRKNVPCRNCYLTECYENKLRCLTEISLEEVFHECRKMWMRLERYPSSAHSFGRVS